MEERFPDEYVTWHHKTPVGVKMDEVFGMDSKSGKVWMEFARQIYAEAGEPYYRVIKHYDNGAPFLENYPGRISVTHTDHFFAVGMLPKTPETDLSVFNPRTAMGIDAERADRAQVLKVRDKFLSEEESSMIASTDIVANLLAWTSKEALYKAALTPGLSLKDNIIIKSLPNLYSDESEKKDVITGIATLRIPTSTNNTVDYEMKLYSYLSYGCIVTVAISPSAVKFG